MIKAIMLSLCVSLTGCATTLGAISALSSAATPKVAASLQIGDKATDITGKHEAVSQSSKIDTIVAKKKAEVDQSVKKVDKKTEIGEVAGSVSVNQGPDALTLFFLAAGWPLFVAFLIYAIVRRTRNVRINRGTSAEDDSGTEGSPEVLDTKVLRAVRLAEDVHQREP